MNDRVMMLYQQAHVVDSCLTDKLNVDKFAESIVKECLSIVDSLLDRNEDGSWTSNELYTDYNGALHLVDHHIRKTFGVEE